MLDAGRLPSLVGGEAGKPGQLDRGGQATRVQYVGAAGELVAEADKKALRSKADDLPATAAGGLRERGVRADDGW